MHDLIPQDTEAGAPPRRVYKRVWQRNKRRENGVQEVEIAPCGTVAAYRRHLRNSEDGDDFCNTAWNADARRRRAVARLAEAEEKLAAARSQSPEPTVIKALKARITEAKDAIAMAEAEMEVARIAAERAQKLAAKDAKGSRSKVA